MAEVEVLVVCEGEDGSLDVRILRRVLEHHGIRARVVPAGDAASLSALRKALKYDEHLSFSIKDRDFLPGTSTIAPKARKLRWRCHEVENFLVAPAVVHAAFERLRVDVPASPWLARAPGDLAAVEVLLRDLATALLPDHIGGLMTAERSVRSTANNPTTFRRPAVTDVAARGWAMALATEAARVVSGCTSLAADPLLQAPAIAAEWARRGVELAASDFLTSDRYLEEMEGKALLGALHGRLALWGARVSKSDLESPLFDALMALLGAPNEPADFRDLADHIKRQITTAP